MLQRRLAITSASYKLMNLFTLVRYRLIITRNKSKGLITKWSATSEVRLTLAQVTIKSNWLLISADALSLEKRDQSTQLSVHLEVGDRAAQYHEHSTDRKFSAFSPSLFRTIALQCEDEHVPGKALLELSSSWSIVRA